MRAVLLTLLLAGCSTGKWADFNYGPAEWMADNWGLEISSLHEDYYPWYLNPEIVVHTVPDLRPYCGRYGDELDGCVWAVNDSGIAAVWLRERAPIGTLAHEKKHARGHCHYQPRHDLRMGMTFDEWNRELERAKPWYPCPGVDTSVDLRPTKVAGALRSIEFEATQVRN